MLGAQPADFRALVRQAPLCLRCCAALPADCDFRGMEAATAATAASHRDAGPQQRGWHGPVIFCWVRELGGSLKSWRTIPLQETPTDALRELSSRAAHSQSLSKEGTKREACAGSPPALPLTLACRVGRVRNHFSLGGYFPRLVFQKILRAHARPAGASKEHGTSGLVAMTSASHAEGRQFDPGLVYFSRSGSCAHRCEAWRKLRCAGRSPYQGGRREMRSEVQSAAKPGHSCPLPLF